MACSSFENVSTCVFIEVENCFGNSSVSPTLNTDARDNVFQIILHSMHKYQPRVHVIRKECGDELSPVKAVPTGDGVKTFSFPETVFTTVTAYQNQQVTNTKLVNTVSCYNFSLISCHDHIYRRLLLGCFMTALLVLYKVNI